MHYFLGLDNGGTKCKAVVFDALGHQISVASQNLPLLTPHPKWTERDEEELWRANADVIRHAIEDSGIDAGRIKSLAVSGHGKGLYLWGKNNRPVRNGIVSTDGRASGIVARWNTDGTADKAFTTNYQGIMACQPIALLRYLKETERASYDEIAWVFEVKDYIRFRLTGKACAEMTDYSGSGLMDLSRRAFTRENLALFGIEEVYDALPPLVSSVDVCGCVTKEAALLTGLAEGTPVAGGYFDIDACAVAMNIVSSDYLCVIAGTWGINQYISRSPVLDHSIRMNSLYPLDGYYLIEESSATSAGNLEWYINTFLGNERSNATAHGESIYAYCDQLVSSVEVADDSIIFLPYVFGSNYNPDAKACLIGLDSHHSQADIITAVFEGIVFCHMVHIERLIKHADFKAVRLAGGVTNSRVWMQMFATVIGLPVETVECREIGALGCAMAAAVATGEYQDLEEAGTHMSRIGAIYYPDEKKRSVYRMKYERYKALSAALDPFWRP